MKIGKLIGGMTLAVCTITGSFLLSPSAMAQPQPPQALDSPMLSAEADSVWLVWHKADSTVNDEVAGYQIYQNGQPVKMVEKSADSYAGAVIGRFYASRSNRTAHQITVNNKKIVSFN